jgi:DNA mismatch endonuclease Vsr
MTLHAPNGPGPAQDTPRGASWASSEQSRARMQRQRQKDTRPEMALRRELTRLGMRYRLQRRPEADLRARMDLVFIGPRVAVDVRGCFWHACPVHGTRPKANASRWQEKLERNVARDQATVEALTLRGWLVVVVWEHEDMRAAADRIKSAVQQRPPRPPSTSVSAA